MKRKSVLGILWLAASALMAAPVMPVDSLTHTDSAALVVPVDSVTPIVVDSLQASLVTDSLMVDALASDSLAVMTDSVAADSITFVLRPNMPVDSTALIMEQVKAMTNMISARAIIDAQLVKSVFSDTAIVNKYNRLLDKMVKEYTVDVASVNVDDTVVVNPLYFRLFAPLVLYKSPVSNVMAVDKASGLTADDSLRIAAMTSGRDLRLLSELDRILLSTYLETPTKVVMTEEVLKANQSVSEETLKNASNNAKLTVQTAIVNPLADVTQAELATDMVVHKPNFWKTKGTFSTQMTESFFSPNWYQGGVNNVNLLSSMTFEANYNNKKKVQWDNKMEARLGFYKNEGAEMQSNQDLLRLTSKLNLKAIRNWNYTVEAQSNTQMMNHYNGDNTLKSKFLAPVDASLTVGMDFKKSFKKGSVSIFPGPLSYKMTYVAVPDLATRYGIEEGKQSRHDIGSKLQVDFNYKLSNNISYKTRFYYYTPYDYVQVDWENTFNFQVSKYLSATMFFHTRFDDHVQRNDKWGYFQFKEYLTFGLNYSW